VDEFCDNFVSAEIPTRLSSNIYNKDFANEKNYEEILEECDRLKRDCLSMQGKLFRPRN
jgi:hypothetical protein